MYCISNILKLCVQDALCYTAICSCNSINFQKKKHIAWKHGFIYNIPNFLIDHAPFIIPVEDTNDIFVFL